MRYAGMEEEHSGQREQQVKGPAWKEASVPGTERRKKQRVRSKVRGQWGAGLCMALL